MDKKKIFVLVFVNIIIVIGLIFLLNWVIYKYFYIALENNQHSPNQRPYDLKRYELDWETIKSKMYYPIRKPVGVNYKKKAILMFGCSYGYGFPLEYKQVLSYKLSKLLKRPVYNYSSPGQSPQFALMWIRSHEIDDIIKKSDYVIYVTIGEHVWRVHCNSNGFHYKFVWPRMIVKKVNNEKTLVLHKSYLPSIEGSYLYKYIEKTWYAKILTSLNVKFVQDYMFDFIKLHFLAIQKELKEINPNIKMIILVFHDRQETELFTSSKRWNELEKEGITVVDVNKNLPQLYERPEEYNVPNDGHPSEKAWDVISNLIVNELKLIN